MRKTPGEVQQSQYVRGSSKEAMIHAPYAYSMVLVRHAYSGRELWHQIATHAIDEVCAELGAVLEVRPVQGGSNAQ